MSVLDAAAGDGNVAAAALARGAEVDACDLAPAWSRAAVRACRAPAGCTPTCRSCRTRRPRSTRCSRASGAVLAPRARRTARELVRVARPGGVVALTAWVPNGPAGTVDRARRVVVPLPEGVRSPAAWGGQDVVCKRLEPLLEDLQLRTHIVRFTFPDPDAFFAALLRPLELDDPPDLRGYGAAFDARYLLAFGRRPA